jgi:hypothetical protein
MKKNFSFSFNSNISVNGKNVASHKANDKQRLTAQQEYWMNRVMRDYGGKIYFIIVLFIVLFFATFIFASKSGNTQNSQSVSKSYELSL